MKSLWVTILSISLLSGCALQAGVLDKPSPIPKEASDQGASATPAPDTSAAPPTSSPAQNASTQAAKTLSPLTH